MMSSRTEAAAANAAAPTATASNAVNGFFIASNYTIIRRNRGGIYSIVISTEPTFLIVAVP